MVATYVVAPLPNWICSKYADPSDFMDSPSTAAVDFGRFLTGFLVVMGIGEWIFCCWSREEVEGLESSWRKSSAGTYGGRGGLVICEALDRR